MSESTYLPQGLVIIEGGEMHHIHTGDGVEDWDRFKDYIEEYDLDIEVLES